MCEFKARMEDEQQVLAAILQIGVGAHDDFVSVSFRFLNPQRLIGSACGKLLLGRPR